MSAVESPAAVTPSTGSPNRAEFRRGFVAMLPLWAGVVPFAVAFAVLARTSGFSTLETQALSMLVFAGSAQLAVVTLVGAGSGGLAVVLTATLLNLRHVLYGLSLNSLLPRRTRPARPLLAAIVTDESYGITVRDYLDGRGSDGFLFGASLSLYGSFAAATLIGSEFGGALGDPEELGLDFIFPLSFLALLLPLLRSRVDLIVAALAGGLALGLGNRVDGGVRVLLAAVVAALAGMVLDRRASS